MPASTSLSSDSPGPARPRGGQAATEVRCALGPRPAGRRLAGRPEEGLQRPGARRDPHLRLLRSPARAGRVVQPLRRPLRADAEHGRAHPRALPGRQLRRPRHARTPRTRRARPCRRTAGASPWRSTATARWAALLGRRRAHDVLRISWRRAREQGSRRADGGGADRPGPQAGTRRRASARAARASRSVVEAEAPLRRGWVEPALKAEFDGLGLALAEVDAQSAAQPAGVKERLKHLSDITHGARALAQRREPDRLRLPHLLPPDRHRSRELPPAGRGRDAGADARGPLQEPQHASTTPSRLRSSRPASRCGRSTPTQIQGDLGLRVSQPQEKLGGDGLELPDGTIVLADERHAVGPHLRRHRAGPGRVARHAPNGRCARSRSRASPTSASRRPCGFAATS